MIKPGSGENPEIEIVTKLGFVIAIPSKVSAPLPLSKKIFPTIPCSDELIVKVLSSSAIIDGSKVMVIKAVSQIVGFKASQIWYWAT